jgi:hypothetical protein
VWLYQTFVSGEFGIQAYRDGYAIVDCINKAAEYPDSECGVNATKRAARAYMGIAELYGVGEFVGQLVAVNSGTIWLGGAQQMSAYRTNSISRFSRLLVDPYVDENDVVHQSRLRDTWIFEFSRATLRGGTVVDGWMNCEAASDAYADPDVVGTEYISDCEHVPSPVP